MFPSSKLKDKFKSVWSTGFGSAAARAERNLTAAHRGDTHDASLNYRGKALRLRDGRNSAMVRQQPDARTQSQHWQRYSQKPRDMGGLHLRQAVSLNQNSDVQSEDYNAAPYIRRPVSSESDNDEEV